MGRRMDGMTAESLDVSLGAEVFVCAWVWMCACGGGRGVRVRCVCVLLAVLHGGHGLFTQRASLHRPTHAAFERALRAAANEAAPAFFLRSAPERRR
jgi:hypothetical protein